MTHRESRRPPWIGLVLVAVIFCAAGCELLVGFGPPASTPFPPLPSPVPAAMADAIEAAEPFATELSRTKAVVSSAWQGELSELCGELCPELSGPGWGVVFRITGPDGDDRDVLVVLDDDLQLVLTQQ